MFVLLLYWMIRERFSAYLTLTSEQMLPLDLVLVLTNGPEKKSKYD